jgi:nucleoprotein TPR
MATTAVDLTYLSTAYSFPKDSLQALLDAPTRDLIESLLKQLAKSAKEHESTQSEKLKADIQLEAAIRNGESRSRHLKASADKNLKDIQDLRQKLNDSGMTSLFQFS